MPDDRASGSPSLFGRFGPFVLVGVLMLALAPLVPFLGSAISPARILLVSGLLRTFGTLAAAVGLAGAGLLGKELPGLARTALVIAGVFFLL